MKNDSTSEAHLVTVTTLTALRVALITFCNVALVCVAKAFLLARRKC